MTAGETQPGARSRSVLRHLAELPAALSRSPFLATVIFLVVFGLFMWLLYPVFAGWVAAPGWFSVKRGLASSGKEFPLFFGMAVIACFCYLTYDERRWQAFKAPVFAFLQRPTRARSATLILIPALSGGLALAGALAGQPEPVANPLRHPTPPEAYSRKTNPFRTPTAELLATFKEKVAAGEVTAENTTEPAVADYARKLAEGSANDELLRQAFLRHTIEEGRVLYQINCRTCHGTKAMGRGPMAWAQRRAVAEFTGVETIATLIEGAVFWRVKKGGIGLPREGAPWESTMPRWETDLTDEQIWKIIMAAFDTAGNAPRELEE